MATKKTTPISSGTTTSRTRQASGPTLTKAETTSVVTGTSAKAGSAAKTGVTSKTTKVSQAPIQGGSSSGIGIGVGNKLPLKPPLEMAMGSFMVELRKELESAADAIAALTAESAELRAEVAELRARYEVHTHEYSRTVTGEGGSLWFSLSQIRNYVEDDEETTWDNYGSYLRGSPVTGNAPDVQTGPPK